MEQPKHGNSIDLYYHIKLQRNRRQFWSRVKKTTEQPNKKQTNQQDHGKVSSCLIASCFAGAVAVSKRM